MADGRCLKGLRFKVQEFKRALLRLTQSLYEARIILELAMLRNRIYLLAGITRHLEDSQVFKLLNFRHTLNPET